MPLRYPRLITAMNTGLFPDACFVRIALAIENGHADPKQISMKISKGLTKSPLASELTLELQIRDRTIHQAGSLAPYQSILFSPPLASQKILRSTTTQV